MTLFISQRLHVAAVEAISYHKVLSYLFRKMDGDHKSLWLSSCPAPLQQGSRDVTYLRAAEVNKLEDQKQTTGAHLNTMCHEWRIQRSQTFYKGLISLHYGQ